MDRLLRNIIKNKKKFENTPKSVIKKANQIALATDKREEKSPFHIDDVLNVEQPRQSQSIFKKLKSNRYIPTPTISEILEKDFMQPIHLSKAHLAQFSCLSLKTINQLLSNQQPITKQISKQLGQTFNVSDNYFLKLQNGINKRKRIMKQREDLNFAIDTILLGYLYTHDKSLLTNKRSQKLFNYAGKKKVHQRLQVLRSKVKSHTLFWKN